MRRTALLMLAPSLVMLALAVCRQEPPHYGTPKEVVAKELAERRQRLASLVRDSYRIPNSRGNRDALVREFLNHIAAGRMAQAETLVLSTEEYRDVFWPNQEERFTMNYGLNPDAAADLAALNRGMALQTLERLLRGRRVDSVRTQWRAEPRPMNALVGHEVDWIEVRVDGETKRIRAVRIVIEHRGQFKVAVINRR